MQIAFMALPLKSIGQGKVHFVPTLEGAEISLDKEYLLKDLGKVTFTKLKFYVGLTNDTSSKSYFLIDFARKSSCLIELPQQKNSLKSELFFWCGVDSFTNTSGIYLGALDPVNGMFWTWQSGYIAIKLEGYIRSMKGDSVSFEYHLGGYHSPFLVYYPVIFKNTKSSDLQIGLDVGRFISLAHQNFPKKVMTPGQDAFLLGKIFSESFYQLDNEK
jgi:hypothetical protein